MAPNINPLGVLIWRPVPSDSLQFVNSLPPPTDMVAVPHARRLGRPTYHLSVSGCIVGGIKSPSHIYGVIFTLKQEA